MSSPSTFVVPVQGTNVDTPMMDQIEQLLSVLVVSENRVVTDGQKTTSKLESVLSAMQNMVKALSEQNQLLREQLLASESRKRETDLVHKQEFAALEGKVEAAQQETSAMRKEMTEVGKKVDEFRAAEITARDDALKTAAVAAEARLEAAKQEAAAARKEVEALRQEYTKKAEADKAAMQAAHQAASAAIAAQIAATKQAFDEKIVKIQKELSGQVAVVGQRVSAAELSIKKLQDQQSQIQGTFANHWHWATTGGDVAPHTGYPNSGYLP